MAARLDDRLESVESSSKQGGGRLVTPNPLVFLVDVDNTLLYIHKEEALDDVDYNVGARPQRLLWASTGTKDPRASDVLYIKALAAPFTVNTMPEGTLKALAEHGELGGLLPADGGDCEEVLARFATAGIDIDALAARVQDEGAKAFVKSWNELMEVLASRSAVLEKAS